MGALRVIEANWRGFRRNWLSGAGPAVAQSLLLLVVFAGLLGRQAARLSDSGDPRALSYAQYVALGIVCSSGMLAGAMEATNSAYDGFRVNDRFATVVTTPVSAATLALGTLLWAFLMAAAITGVVSLLAIPFLSAAGLAPIPVFMILSGLGAAAISGPLCALVSCYYRTPQVINITGRVILFPLVLFSATYFPERLLPGWAGRVLGGFPLVHANVAARDAYGGAWAHIPGQLPVLLAWSVLGAAIMARAFAGVLYA
jgi:lipooligosaccharide transport system permease protein